MMKKLLRKIELLLIDDDRDDVFLFKKVLEDRNSPFSLTVATDGEEALEILLNMKLKKYNPDLVLLDLMMPKVDGFEFLSKMKHDDDLKHLPVIVFSDSDYPSTVEKAYKFQASAYIMKPHDSNGYDRVVGALENWWCNTIVLPGNVVLSLDMP